MNGEKFKSYMYVSTESEAITLNVRLQSLHSTGRNKEATQSLGRYKRSSYLVWKQEQLGYKAGPRFLLALLSDSLKNRIETQICVPLQLILYAITFPSCTNIKFSIYPSSPLRSLWNIGPQQFSHPSSCWGFYKLNFFTETGLLALCFNPQPGGPGLHIYIPWKLGGPVIPPGTEYPF
jgi:hypothetical protein